MFSSIREKCRRLCSTNMLRSLESELNIETENGLPISAYSIFIDTSLQFQMLKLLNYRMSQKYAEKSFLSIFYIIQSI